MSPLLLLLSSFFLASCYFLFIGNAPSVIRAYGVFALYAAGQILKVTPNPLNILSVCCFLLFLWHPPIIFHIGFQLSFLATLGIIAIYPICLKGASYLLHSFSSPFDVLFNWSTQVTCLHIAVCVTTAPCLLLIFPSFPLQGFVYSPFIALLIPLIYFSFAIACCLHVFTHFGWRLLEYTTTICIEFLSHVPKSCFLYCTVSISPFASMCIYLALLFLIVFHTRKEVFPLLLLDENLHN